jgi:hypothetical protein
MTPDDGSRQRKAHPTNKAAFLIVLFSDLALSFCLKEKG